VTGRVAKAPAVSTGVLGFTQRSGDDNATNSAVILRCARFLARFEGWLHAQRSIPSFEARKCAHLRMTFRLQQGYSPMADGKKNPSSPKKALDTIFTDLPVVPMCRSGRA
jgi:hypothetical protein